MAGTNLISPVLTTKFDWHHQNGEFYIVLLDAAGILGMAIGSLICGSFIKHGRRKTFIMFNIIGMATIIPQLFNNIVTIFIGRFFFGICTGILASTGAKMIDELVPVRLLGLYGPATSVFMTFGMFNSMILGLMLPSSQDTQGQRENDTWRVILGFPLLY